MHHPKGFPSRLVRLRADAGMTQRDLAKASGLSVPQIGRYEMGTSQPRMTALVKLANALGCEVEKLQDVEDQPEVVEMTLVEEGEKDLLIALPRSTIDSLHAQAAKYGVTEEIMLNAIIDFFHAETRGEKITIKEAIAKVVEEAKTWPPLPD
ncbi:helix-turn-helix domain-containing protein [Pseudomonas protegens]|nr:helix-turn-helix domain-containing protein [Pseudomonas protegens]